MPFGLNLTEEELARRMLQSAKRERQAARKRDGGYEPRPTPSHKKHPVDPKGSTRYTVLQLLSAQAMITNELLNRVTVTRQQLKVVLRRLQAEGLITKTYEQQGHCKMAKWSKL